MTEPQEKDWLEYIKKGGLVCPRCGDSRIEGGSWDPDDTGVYQDVGCTECGEEWRDRYKLVGCYPSSGPFYIEAYHVRLVQKGDEKYPWLELKVGKVTMSYLYVQPRRYTPWGGKNERTLSKLYAIRWVHHLHQHKGPDKNECMPITRARLVLEGMDCANLNLLDEECKRQGWEV